MKFNSYKFSLLLGIGFDEMQRLNRDSETVEYYTSKVKQGNIILMHNLIACSEEHKQNPVKTLSSCFSWFNYINRNRKTVKVLVPSELNKSFITKAINTNLSLSSKMFLKRNVYLRLDSPYLCALNALGYLYFEKDIKDIQEMCVSFSDLYKEELLSYNKGYEYTLDNLINILGLDRISELYLLFSHFDLEMYPQFKGAEWTNFKRAKSIIEEDIK